MSRHHYRLLSLWDMYRFDAVAYHKALYVIVEAIGLVRQPAIEFAGAPLGEAASRSAIAQLDNLSDALETLAVPITKIAVRELKEKLEDQSKFEVTFSQDWKALTEISETLRRELMGAMVFAVDSAKADYYDPAKPHFGIDVAAKFPGLAYDISEAGKCLALERATASAFHSLRCLEGGFAAMWRCVGISDPISGFERNWNNRMRKVEDEVERRWPKKTGRMGGDARLFDEVCAALSALQNPYRNATMHLDQTYTAEDAKHVFEMVGGILRKIASRMDENGVPLA